MSVGVGVAVFTRPTGYVSVTAAPVTVSPEFGLVKMMLSVENAAAVTPVLWMDMGLNDLTAVGGTITVSVAVLLGTPAAPVCVDVTPDVVLVCAPTVVLVTFTLNVQVPGVTPTAAGSAPPLRLMELPPAAAVTVPPPQLPTMAGVAATTIFTKLSLNATPVSGVAVGLLRVKVSVDVAPDKILAGENALVIPGLPTDRVAVAAPPVPALVEVTAPVVLT